MGMIEKSEITASFLKRKLEEYDLLKQEIAELQEQVKR